MAEPSPGHSHPPEQANGVNQPRSDHALGAALGVYRQQLPASDPRALRSALQDLLPSDRQLAQPLRHLIELPGFQQLNPADNPGLRLVRRDALLQELAELYRPEVLQRVAAVLDGYLGMPLADTSQTQGLASAANTPGSISPERGSGESMSQHKRFASKPSSNATDPVVARTQVGQNAGNGSQTPSSGQDWFQIGLDFSEQGDHYLAIDAFSQHLCLHPGHSEAYLERAKAKMSLANNNSALIDLDTAITLNPNASAAFVLRGTVFAKLGARSAAVENWRTASRLGNQEARELLERWQIKTIQDFLEAGQRAANRGYHQLALESFSKALDIDPNHQQALFLRGRSLLQLNQLMPAIEVFNHLLKIDSQDSEVYALREDAYARLKQRELASSEVQSPALLGHRGKMLAIASHDRGHRDSFDRTNQIHGSQTPHDPTSEPPSLLPCNLICFSVSTIFLIWASYNRAIAGIYLISWGAIVLFVQSILFPFMILSASPLSDRDSRIFYKGLGGSLFTIWTGLAVMALFTGSGELSVAGVMAMLLHCLLFFRARPS